MGVGERGRRRALTEIFDTLEKLEKEDERSLEGERGKNLMEQIERERNPRNVYIVLMLRVGNRARVTASVARFEFVSLQH